MKKLILSTMLFLFLLQGYATEQFVFFQKTAGDFTLINQGIPCRIIIDADEDEGIRMAADNLKEDFFAYRVISLLFQPLQKMILFAFILEV